MSYHHEGALDTSITTTDDRLKRLEDILTALTKSVISKNISHSSPPECNVDKVQDEPSKTMINSKKKRNYIPFNEPLVTTYDSYLRFYTIKFDQEDKRKINPYLLRNETTTLTGNPPKRLTTSGRDRKSTRLNSSHSAKSRMPSSA